METQLRVRGALVGIGIAALLIGACKGAIREPAGDRIGSQLGQVGVALQVAPGTMLRTVRYTLTRGGEFARSGALQASVGTTFNLVLRLPAGAGYRLGLAAQLEGEARCVGMAEFDVVIGGTTRVDVRMRCEGAPSLGTIHINGNLNLCPFAERISAMPAQARIGGSIVLVASVRDVDSGPAPLMQRWSASSGTFADPAALSTRFTCTQAGRARLVLALADGDEGCTGAGSQLEVLCVDDPPDVHDGGTVTAGSGAPDAGLDVPSAAGMNGAGIGGGLSAGSGGSSRDADGGIDAGNSDAAPSEAGPIGADPHESDASDDQDTGEDDASTRDNGERRRSRRSG